MKGLWRVTLLAVALSLVLAPAVLAETKLVKKVDNFVVYVDQSGSMAQKHAGLGQKKIDIALDAITRMDKAIPPLDYTAGMALFSPFKMVAGPAAYKDGMLADAAGQVDNKFHVFGRLTAIGDGFNMIDETIAGFSGKTALLVFTDGENNYGSDPVAEAKALYAKYGNNLCIHVVSLADGGKGQQVIDEIRALSGCTVATDVKALADDAVMAQYVKDVFYDEVVVKAAPAPAPPPPAPAPAPAPVAKQVITFNLLFGFDKYQITDEMIPVLEQAKLILEEDPDASFTVAGHTDSTGPEAYNQGLSERRAASVKNWLVDNGIAASRLDTVGYGETQPKYDNGTREGRKLNRRVEITTK